jgi:hypothetical protein
MPKTRTGACDHADAHVRELRILNDIAEALNSPPDELRAIERTRACRRTGQEALVGRKSIEDIRPLVLRYPIRPGWPFARG